MSLGSGELFRRYGYHRQGPATAPLFELNRAAVLLVAEIWDRSLPPGRETALAFTELEAALQRANQAVACNLDPHGEPPGMPDVEGPLGALLDLLHGPDMTRSGVAPPLVAPDRPGERTDGRVARLHVDADGFCHCPAKIVPHRHLGDPS